MKGDVRIITLWQPWASLMALKLKCYETRSWKTAFRGPLLIHAAQRQMRTVDVAVWERAIAMKEGFRCPAHLHPVQTYGRVVAEVDLTGCYRMVEHSQPCNGEVISVSSIAEAEMEVGLWEVGRFAWECQNVRPLNNPFLWVGRQGLRWASPELLQAVRNDLESAA